LVTDLFDDFGSILFGSVAKCKMPSNWKIPVTKLHHRLDINVGKQLYVCMSCMFAKGADDDATTCAFSRGVGNSKLTEES
jgi:hypothetical protein